MAYQTQKILELDQENQEPIGSLRGAILVNDSGERFFQLKLKNNLAHRIEGAKVQIVCYDEDGMYIGSQSYVYQSVGAKPGEIFGTNRAIPIEFEGTDSFSIIGEELEESEPEIEEEPEPDQEISGDFWERPARAGKVKGPGTDWPMAVGLGLLAGMLGGICGVAVYLLYIAISWKREGTPGISMERLMPKLERTTAAWLKLIAVVVLFDVVLGGIWTLGYLLYRLLSEKRRKRFWERMMDGRLAVYGGILAAVILLLHILMLLRSDPMVFFYSWLWDQPQIALSGLLPVIGAIAPVYYVAEITDYYPAAAYGLALLPLVALLWKYNQKPLSKLNLISLAYYSFAMFMAIWAQYCDIITAIVLPVVLMAQLSKIGGKDCRAAAWLVPGQIVLTFIIFIVADDEVIPWLMSGGIQILILNAVVTVFLLIKCGVIETAIFVLASFIPNILALIMLFEEFLPSSFSNGMGAPDEVVPDAIVGIIGLLSALLLSNMIKRGEKNVVSCTEGI